jgi:hypothetical protein
MVGLLSCHTCMLTLCHLWCLQVRNMLATVVKDN